MISWQIRFSRSRQIWCSKYSEIKNVTDPSCFPGFVTCGCWARVQSNIIHGDYKWIYMWMSFDNEITIFLCECQHQKSACKVCPQFASPGCGCVFACGLYASQFVVRSPERRSSDHPPAPTITAFEVPTLLQALVKLGNSPHRESEGRRRRFGSHTYNTYNAGLVW